MWSKRPSAPGTGMMRVKISGADSSFGSVSWAAAPPAKAAAHGTKRIETRTRVCFMCSSPVGSNVGRVATSSARSVVRGTDARPSMVARFVLRGRAKQQHSRDEQQQDHQNDGTAPDDDPDHPRVEAGLVRDPRDFDAARLADPGVAPDRHVADPASHEFGRWFWHGRHNRAFYPHLVATLIDSDAR